MDYVYVWNLIIMLGTIIGTQVLGATIGYLSAALLAGVTS
jgi:hypothetical protein